jgi:hypothetical protein
MIANVAVLAEHRTGQDVRKRPHSGARADVGTLAKRFRMKEYAVAFVALASHQVHILIRFTPAPGVGRFPGGTLRGLVSPSDKPDDASRH